MKTTDYLGIGSAIENTGLEAMQMFRYLPTFLCKQDIMNRNITICKNANKWLTTSLPTFLSWMHFLMGFVNKGFVTHEYYCLWL